MNSGRIYLLKVNVPAFSTAEIIEPVLENINISSIEQNHSSVTILIEFVSRYQMNITTEF